MNNDNKIDLSGAINKPDVSQSVTPVASAETLPSTVSFSSLTMFETCQYSWYLQYVKKLQVPRSTFALDMGSAFHRMAEIYDGSVSLDELMADPELGALQADAVLEARKVFERWYTPEKMADILVIDGKPMREKYFEYPVSVDGHDIKLIGYIDAIRKKGDDIEVVDYKTGSSLYTKDLQLDIYSMPVFRDNPQLTKIRVTFEYVAEGAHGVTKSRIVLREDAMATESVVKGKVAAILESFKNNNFPGKPGKFCKFCPFTGACEFYQKYLKALPESPENIKSADELRKRIEETNAKIEVEKQLVADMQEALEALDPSSVSKFTIYEIKAKVSTIIDTLRNLHVPPDRYFLTKSTLGTDLMKGRLPVSDEIREKLLENSEVKVYRRVESNSVGDKNE
jgi:CRISPR/Cas system-associated exonuclease Cas4 (RecB family)